METNNNPVMERYLSSIDGVFLETVGGRILDCNAAACEMYGYSREEMLELNVFDLVPHEIARTIPDVILNNIQKGGSTVAAAGIRKDGFIFKTFVTTQLIEEGDEKMVLVIVRRAPD